MTAGKQFIRRSLLLALAAITPVLAQSALDTIPAAYDNVVDTLFDDYDLDDDILPAQYDTDENITPNQTKPNQTKQYDINGNTIQNQYGENINIPPTQSDTASTPARDTINVRVPKSQDELDKMSRDELYKLAFRRAAPERPRNLMMNLIVEDKTFGNTEIVYDPTYTSFNFVSPLLSRYLDTLLWPGARKAAGDSAGYFNSAALEAAGYAVNISELQYELRVEPPAQSKILQKTNLGGGYARQPAGPEAKPAALSFYVNYRADDRISYSQYRYSPSYDRFKYDDEGYRDPISADLDGALNAYGWVLESSARLREPYSSKWASWNNFARGDARLVRDIVPWRVRLSAGDVDMSSDLLPSGEYTGGLRLEYNDWFFGGEPASARSKVAFFMPRAGEVELYMDGRYQRRFLLPAGNHEISGFGGNVGRNKVRLVLRMDNGSVEEIPYEFILGDPRNMLKGEARYTITAGVRRSYAPSPACYTYDIDDPAATADILYGLLPSVSTGAAAQASRENALAATQILWNMGSPGWLNARFYGNRDAQTRTPGGRADLNYTADLGNIVKALDRALFHGNGIMPNMSLSLRGYCQTQYYNANLFPANKPAGKNADIGGASGNYGFGIFRGSVSASGGATFYREIPTATVFYPMAYNLGLRVQQSVKQATFSVNAGTDVRGGEYRPYFSAFTNYALGARFGRHNFSASGDVSLRSAYIEPYKYYERIDYTDSTNYMDYTRYVDSMKNIYHIDTMNYMDSIRYMDSISTTYTTNYPARREIEVKGHNEYATTWGANAGWRWSNGGNGAGAQSYAASAGMRGSLGIPNAGANANNSFNRAQTWLDYNLANYNNAGYSTHTHSARAEISGSLMFADGLWALGRQTNGSFLLIDTKDNLKNATVHVNRSRANRLDFSRNGTLGAAYQNYLMNYRPTEVSVNLTGVEPGALIESDVYHANAAYKRGHALRLGDKPRTIALVRLTDNGEPLRYTYASIEPEDYRGGVQERRATFTGGDGVLQMGNLTPGGTYRIKFGAAAYVKDIIIKVPRGAGALMELGEIEVERE